MRGDRSATSFTSTVNVNASVSRVFNIKYCRAQLKDSLLVDVIEKVKCTVSVCLLTSALHTQPVPKTR